MFLTNGTNDDQTSDFSGLGRDDISTDVDIDINNSPDAGNNSNSNDGAVIALSIVLALVLLGIIAGLLYYKRRLGVVYFNFLHSLFHS